MIALGVTLTLLGMAAGYYHEARARRAREERLLVAELREALAEVEERSRAAQASARRPIGYSHNR